MTIDQLLHIVKVVAIAQLGIMIVSFFLFYLLRVFFKINDRRLNKKTIKITHLLNELMSNKIELSHKLMQFFQKNLRELLGCMRNIEDTTPTLPTWFKVKQHLSDYVLKPKARQLAASSRWLKQYLTVLCFDYGIDPKNDDMLSKLVRSDTFIVSLNAARVIFKYPTPATINALIDSLAQGRRMQQSLYAEVLITEHTNADEVIINTFVDRLRTEQDPYIKTFCYRILMLLTPSHDALKTTVNDILSETIDLKIAALNYLARFQDADSRKTLRQFLNDQQVAVKAVVAKLIGDINDLESIGLLEEKLHDPAWWVRINAALALSKLGKKGILALQNQSAQTDNFAYETAQKVLITLGSTK